MSSLLLGAVLGFIFSVLGAGGGVLAVPALTWLIGVPLSEATALSLGLVFAAAVTSTAGHARAKRVEWPTVLRFAPSSMLGAAVGSFLAPKLPATVTTVAFASLLLVASVSLVRKAATGVAPKVMASWLVFVTGLGIGVLTGVLGVGGGFLVVPVLVSLLGLSAPRAVGTSSAIILLNTAVGAVAALIARPQLAAMLAPLAAGAVVGALLGVPFAGKLPERALKLTFAAVSAVVAVGLLVQLAV